MMTVIIPSGTPVSVRFFFAASATATMSVESTRFMSPFSCFPGKVVSLFDGSKAQCLV